MSVARTSPPWSSQDQLGGHGEHLLEGLRAVVVLDLGQLGGVDQREGEVAGLAQLLGELAQPLVVRRDLRVQGISPTG